MWPGRSLGVADDSIWTSTLAALVEIVVKRLIPVLLIALSTGSCGGDTQVVATTKANPSRTPKAADRTGTDGVTVRVPKGWHSTARTDGLGPVTDPLARVVVSSKPIARRASQCYIASYSPPSDGVTLVIVEWESTDASPPPRPARFTPNRFPLRTGAIECFEGFGGGVPFSERNRVFGAYILRGMDASEELADEARAVLDTLDVATRTPNTSG